MVNNSQSLARSFVNQFVYPFFLLLAGLLLAAWLTPIVVPLWDANERVPDVYAQPEDVGRAALEAAGFDNLSFRKVCSSSVASGNIREVVVKNGAPAREETSPVNKYVNGVNTPVLDVSKSTPLEIKVGNGVPC
jgi:beta-lactam-binding protein with PASTA domain